MVLRPPRDERRRAGNTPSTSMRRWLSASGPSGPMAPGAGDPPANPASGEDAGSGDGLRTHFRRALTFVRPDARACGGILVLTLLIAGMNAAEPLVLKFIFDRLAAGDTVNALAMGVGLLLGLMAMREGVNALSNWMTWRVRLRVHHRLLEATVGKLHSLPVAFHRERTVGATMTKLDRGISGYLAAFTEVAFSILPSIAYLGMALVLMFQLDWRLSLLVLAFAPVPALIGAWAAEEQTRRERNLLDRWAAIYSRFNEVLSGIVTVKSFAKEDEEKRRFLSHVGEAQTVVVRGVARDSAVGATTNLVTGLARIAAIALGGYLILHGQATVGTLVAFLGFIGGLFGPVQGLTGTYQTLRKAAVSLEVIFGILDAQDRLGDAPDAREVPRVAGRVDFDHVSFAYREDEQILHDIDLHVEPGEVVAIVGPSGSGKSSLMALLQRLYDPSTGAIRVDGHDIRSLKQRALRRHIGVVLQDAALFNDTVHNVIAYGRPEASRGEVIAAAKAAHAHDFISRLPEGYDTLVGERGGRFSGGERQRIAIARALLKDPSILILDEATSALDAESEALVQAALDELIKDRTTFVIAHRLSTVVSADRILVLHHGQIVESGTHDELLRRGGYYAFLVRHQTRGLLLAGDAAPPVPASPAAAATRLEVQDGSVPVQDAAKEAPSDRGVSLSHGPA